MDKKFADEMISRFQKRFFGFALAKTASVDEAEELAARIVCEAYITLRSAEHICNWEGYMYKIASNVYARYVKERKRHGAADIDVLELGDDTDIEQQTVKKEELMLLRRELAWLGRLHRKIILEHYYHNKKIAQISEELRIPSGTIKWHLSDAKKSIKEGMKKMRNQNQGIEPICFRNLSHNGSAGDMGSTADFLNSRLRQNIVYATYFEAKTVEEIADMLGMTPVYVEDEVDFLEEYGFLEKLPGGKYLTTVFVTDVPMEVQKQCGQMDLEIAKAVNEQYIPLLKEQFCDFERFGITVPEGDYNYLLWSLIPNALTHISAECKGEKANIESYRIKRKDGGDYVAMADVYTEEMEKTINPHYCACGDMGRYSNIGPLASWSLSTDFDSRVFGWQDNRNEDYDYFALYLADKLPKTEAVVEKYARLYDRGFIYNNDGQDEVNVVTVQVKKCEDGSVNAWDNPVTRAYPKLPESLKQLIAKKSADKLELMKKYYPKRMHGLLECFSRADINKVLVLDAALASGVLTPLSERQKRGVMQMVFVGE